MSEAYVTGERGVRRSEGQSLDSVNRIYNLWSEWSKQLGEEEVSVTFGRRDMAASGIMQDPEGLDLVALDKYTRQLDLILETTRRQIQILTTYKVEEVPETFNIPPLTQRRSIGKVRKYYEPGDFHFMENDEVG